MAEEQTSLLPFYKGWDTYQNLLLKAIAPLSAEQLALRTAPHLRSVGENVAHIIGARAGWFHTVMGEGDATIAPLYSWDEPDAPTRSTTELLHGLELTWQMIQSALARWTPADLDKIFEPVWSGKTHHFTRQWIIWHVIEHDLHHGGEVSLTLGTHHLEGPDI